METKFEPSVISNIIQFTSKNGVLKGKQSEIYVKMLENIASMQKRSDQSEYAALNFT